MPAAALWLFALSVSIPTSGVRQRPCHDALSDSSSMCIIAVLPSFRVSDQVPCGDADRDGRREIYARGQPPDPGPGYALEYASNNCFDTIRLTDGYSPFECIGDPDRDGLCDLTAKHWGRPQGLVIFESPDSFSLPSEMMLLVGAQQALGFYPVITDVDVDSAREISYCNEFYGVNVYECVGDNRYELMAELVPRSHAETFLPVQTEDMDQDGLPELAVNCDQGLVLFYEAVGNDTLALKATVRILDSTINCWCGLPAATPDLDRDGGPELIATCYSWDLPMFTVAVIESPADDSFAVVWADTMAGGGQFTSVSMGDIDGDSVLEFLVADGRYLRLYRCAANNRYECFWQTDSGSRPARLYDINSDGRDELIHSFGSRESILIREWLPVGVGERVAEKLKQIEIQPSVVRSQGVVRVSGLPPSARVEVVDATGRVVASGSSGASTFVLGTLDLEAGAYFIRIRVGNQAVVRKVLVVD